MTPQELLNGAGIFVPDYFSPRQYTTCPRCSANRKTHHQKLKCLGVTIDGDHVRWGCNHCQWTGPEKGNGNGTDSWPCYYYGPDLRKVRHPAGGFFWQHRGNGAWERGAARENTGSLLYRIEEVEAAIRDGETILVVEGEKDANTCWKLGFVATCNAHGASSGEQRPKWTSAHSSQLSKADVVVLCDNDGPGRAHAAAICSSLLGVARSIRTIDLVEEWDELPASGDVSDWAAWAGPGAAARLEDLVRQAKAYEPIASQPGPAAPSPSNSHTLAELKGKTFLPLKWVVERYIPEGVTLLAGKPKIGKSWLVLGAAISGAREDLFLGERCQHRQTLYCALEENERRMQRRTEKLIGTSEEWPATVRCTYTVPTLDHDGIAHIEREYLDKEPIDLVIIDTLAAFKGAKNKNEDAYAHDYRTMNALHDLARRRTIDIIVVHHVRKQTAEDVFDTISGTYGLSAACDTMVVLTKEKEELRLCTRGRDVEPEDKTLDFDIETAEWTVTGDYDDSPQDEARGDTRLRIMAELETSPMGMSPKQIAEATGIRAGTVRVALKRMVANREIKRNQYKNYEPFRRKT